MGWYLNKMLCLTQPSPKERAMKARVKVLSFGENLGEAKIGNK